MPDIEHGAIHEALVNAARTATAASDIFTQDVEDQPGFARAAHDTYAQGRDTSIDSPQQPSQPVQSDTAFLDLSPGDRKVMVDFFSLPDTMSEKAYQAMWDAWNNQGWHIWPDVPGDALTLAYQTACNKTPVTAKPAHAVGDGDTPPCPDCGGHTAVDAPVSGLEHSGAPGCR